MEVAGVEPEQAKAKGSNGDIMAGSIRCLNREPPYKAVGGTLATAPSRRSKQGGMRCPLPNTLSRFNRMRDAVAPNMLLGELPEGQLKERCQRDQGASLSRTRIATSSKYPSLQDAHLLASGGAKLGMGMTRCCSI